MPCCSWLNTRLYAIKLLHTPMIQVSIFLNQLHGLKLFQLGFFAYFIFCFSAFFFKMSGIGNITYIPHLITFPAEVSVNNIKGYIRPRMTEMTLTAHCWTTNIHAYQAGSNRFEFFFFFSIGIIDLQSHK